MKTNILATAVALSDQDLLCRIDFLAGKEREVSAELVAHLAALEMRPSLYAAQGYGSLYAYCTEYLRLSEDAACTRIAVARACRDFPVVLDLLVAGSLTLTSIRKLSPHLTAENHQAVLARAADGNKEKIAALVAELAPKPDVVSLVRKLPVRMQTPATSAPMTSLPLEIGRPDPSAAGPNESEVAPATTPPPALRPGPRPVVQALAPERYRVQFTIGQETHDKLQRVQALLRREVPSGDPGVIFDRFLDVLLEKVERAKLGKRARPSYENRIRSGTDQSGAQAGDKRAGRSRHIPSAVRRAVWFRDRGQCAFVASTGHRCTERSFLELHHIHPYALNGPPTLGNISLRCRRHNQFEGELVFAPLRTAATRRAGVAARGALNRLMICADFDGEARSRQGRRMRYPGASTAGATHRRNRPRFLDIAVVAVYLHSSQRHLAEERARWARRSCWPTTASRSRRSSS